MVLLTKLSPIEERNVAMLFQATDDVVAPVKAFPMSPSSLDRSVAICTTS